MSDPAPDITERGGADFEEGRLVACTVAGEPVVAARVGGRVRAVSGTCPHRGAPLAEGLLQGLRLVCPWHHAAFDMDTGAVLDAPAFDPLARHAVEENGPTVRIHPADERPHRARPARAGGGPGVVVVGSGAAGFAAADLLRARGYDAAITILSRDDRQPYDRTELSKLYLAGEEGPEVLPLRPPEYYKNLRIDLRLGTSVTEVDHRAAEVVLESGARLAYQALVLATGSVPRTIPVPGHDLENVLTFRTLSDADRLRDMARHDLPVVVVGSSFIGMEVAAALRQRGCSVSVVSNEARPYERVVGTAVGEHFRRHHQQHGVRFRWRSSLSRLEGRDEAVDAVTLEDGTRLEARAVVLGVGVRPQLPDLGFRDRNQDGSIDVDGQMRVGPGIWAVGDIARFPARGLGRVRVEHWRVAEQQGRVAALSILGEPVEFAATPFFWTLQLGASMRYVGWPSEWEREVVLGNPDEGRFLSLLGRGDAVVGAAGVEQDRDIAALGLLLEEGRAPGLAELAAGGIDLPALAAQAPA